jgi:hypothetical protein
VDPPLQCMLAVLIVISMEVARFEVSRKILAHVKMSNRYIGPLIAPHVDLNEIIQYLNRTEREKIVRMTARSC